MSHGLREGPLIMSDFRGGWGSEMTPNIWTLEGKNWTLVWGNEGAKIVGHHLWMIPNLFHDHTCSNTSKAGGRGCLVAV